MVLVDIGSNMGYGPDSRAITSVYSEFSCYKWIAELNIDLSTQLAELLSLWIDIVCEEKMQLLNTYYIMSLRCCTAEA